jgi:hypothetical protein
MKTVLLALLLVGAPAAVAMGQAAAPAPAVPVAPAAPVDASGVWTITGDVQGNPVNETCTFAQKDLVLTGSCSSDMGKYDTTGTVDGTKVVFKHGGTYQGTDLTLTFTGTVAADGGLSGVIDVDPFQVSGDFKALKTATAKNS